MIDVETHICPCCGKRLHRIGETVKETFDVVPMQYRVKRIMRPRYGCRGCRQGVLQASAPAQAVEGGMVTEALPAHIAAMKYGAAVIPPGRDACRAGHRARPPGADFVDGPRRLVASA